MSKKQENEKCTCHSEEQECNCEQKQKDNIEHKKDRHCHKEECKKEKVDKNKEFEEKIKSLEDALLRSQAELLNYRKRKDEETQRILKYAEEDILKGFLPILDNFERAILMDDNNFGDQISKFLEGFRMVYDQTKSLLEKFEVKEIDCLGKEFDPAVAQAVLVEKDDTKESGVVLEVLQKGYMYKDRVLRIAMVKVNE